METIVELLQDENFEKELYEAIGEGQDSYSDYFSIYAAQEAVIKLLEKYSKQI